MIGRRRVPGRWRRWDVTTVLALAVAWAVLRPARVVEAERRRLVAEVKRSAERSRTARELHDAVTHLVTAMVVQAEAARYLSGSPERLDQGLTAITDTGRRSIADLRHLLDLMKPEHDGDPRTPPVGDRSRWSTAPGIDGRSVAW
ncbi:histidine kinase [Saccharothrix carnea]|uniref:histidine kinase n=1 Tax=Saccharothrix TaxID=2071 RepID=UPI00095F0C36|nr:hypothetical protein A6A25_21890 [Saccharothrix sp. CB00851]